MNVLLIGEDAAGIRALKSLRQTGSRIVAVMTRENRSEGSLWAQAAKLGLTVWPAQLVRNPGFAQQVREHQVDIVLNVHSLFLIQKEILAAPRLGSYNLHPGPLPRYAGLNSVCWAIYRGETQHGVTLHKMEPDIDTGAIVYQEILDIGPAETGLSLSTRCVNAGIPLMLKLLEAAERDPGGIPLTPQDPSQREYFGREIPDGGTLFWDRPAKQIFNFVRACDYFPFPSPWGHPRTRIEGTEFEIAKVQLTGKPVPAGAGTVGEVSDAGVEVACGDEWILVRKIFAAGKYLPARSVLKAGDQFENR